VDPMQRGWSSLLGKRNFNENVSLRGILFGLCRFRLLSGIQSPHGCWIETAYHTIQQILRVATCRD
jgi:hypothetical protein